MKAAMLLVTAEGLSELKWAWFTTQRPLSDLAKYDMASRGPWGSLRLLWTLRGRDSIASIGAFVTIAALAIDPFAQQLVRYYNCRVADLTLNATVPRTGVYDELGRDEGAGLYTIDPGMQAAINNGVYNTGGVSIPFNCPSGNCTFDTPYHSVGYCTSCSDMSTNLTIHVTNFTYASGPFTTVNTTLPSGLSTTWGLEDDNGTYFVMGPSEYFSTTYEMIFGVGAGNKTPWDEQESLLFTPEQLEACSDPATSDSWLCNGFGAAECSILPCIKTYRGTVNDGTLTERVENIPWVFSNYSSGHAATVVDVDCLSPHQKEFMQSKGYQIRNDTHWIWYDVAYEDPYLSDDGEGGPVNSSGAQPWVDTQAGQSAVPRECFYEILMTSDESMIAFLGTYLQGSITANGDAGFLGPSVIQALFNSGNVTFTSVNSTFTNVVDSMTAYIRQHGNANFSTPALGLVYLNETCVHVYWGWLAFPAALVCLTILFFVAMITKTRLGLHQGYDWKSSPFPLLFHGLHEDTLDQYDSSNMVQVQDMAKAAEDVHVRLSLSEKGWRLIKME